MRRKTQISAAVLGLAVLASSVAVGTARAQEGGGLSGWVRLGLRTLDLSGGRYAQGKYDEDVNFQDGVRVMGLALQGTFSGTEVDLNLSGWGPDPEPTSSLSGHVSRPGLYRLRFGGYNAQYFHSTASLVDEFNLDAPSYAYTRRGRWADLAVHLGDLPQIRLRFDRFRREGSVSQVWNIEREKYSALTPVDETFTTLSIGTAIPISIASVELSFALHQIDSFYGATVPEPNVGLDGRASSLTNYAHIIRDEGTLPVLKANVSAPIGPATLRIGYSSSSGSVDKTLNQTEQGIDYQGAAVDTTISAAGRLDRSFSILDAGVGIPLIKDFTADLSIRQTDYEVDGTWDPSGADTDVGTTVSSTRIQGRLIWRPTRGVSIDLGGASISRDFEETGPRTGKVETTSTDWVGGFTYKRQEWFSLRLSHQIGDIQDPFTRLSPTDRNITRGKLTVKPLEWLNGFLAYETGSATRYYSENSSDPDYWMNTRTGDVRRGTIGFNVPSFPLVRELSGLLAYTRGRLEMSVPIAATSPPTPNVFNYRDISHAVSGMASYELSDGFSIEASGTWFRSIGQWPLYRFTRRLGVARDLGMLVLHLDYRMYSLSQVADDRDDYDANVFTFGFSRGF